MFSNEKNELNLFAKYDLIEFLMQTFNELKKNLKKDFSGLKKIKIAILGDSATQFLSTALRGFGFECGFDFEIFDADFNQIENQVYRENSELYEFNPNIVIVFQSAHKLLGKYNKTKIEQLSLFASLQIDNVKNLFDIINSKLQTKIIYYNSAEIDDSVFGNFANKIESSFVFQQRKFNFELMNLATNYSNLFICDISAIQNKIGKDIAFQPSVYINTEMVLSIDILPEVAKRTVDIICAFEGKIKKCLILDLDNTLWGGVIGDDGLENIQIGGLGIGKAFTEFQYWIKKLKNRGLILAVCSKNTESVAKEPFEKHPDMVLRLDDIAVFVANWENKADNIKNIQQILNIGFDSMVFLDDNPFERNIVRENIPGITVPELPEDPAEYLEFLYSENLFETISFSNEDAERTKQYQVEAQRTILLQKSTNVDDFLKGLEMKSLVESFNKFNTPRVAQLSQRSNQYNLRTVRYTDADIERISMSENYLTFAFTLEDKFGDNGLICVLVLEKNDKQTLFIESWFMSCRVLKRGMEDFVMNTLVSKAKELNLKFLKGEYIPTAKNEMVKDHYKNQGFVEESGFWILDIETFNERNCYIQNK